MTPLNIDQLLLLNETYHSPHASFHTIFGGFKSGKTSFIRDFIIKKNYIYFGTFGGCETILFPHFVEVINKKFKIHNSSTYYDQFEKILTLFDEQIIDEKMAVIFDNFEELMRIEKNALALLLRFWEKSLSKKPLQIILLSSSQFGTPFYKKYEKYLQNRIFLEPFSFEHIKNKPNLTPRDRFYIYSVFGSSSYLVSHYNPKIEFVKNIYHLALNPSSPFFDYGINYLKRESNDTGTFASILYAIANGNNKIGEIATLLKLKSTDLSRYIERLQQLMVIKKELPLSKNFTFSRHGRYYICDNFLRFWFCYIYPNLDNLELKKHPPVLKMIDETIIQKILTPTYSTLAKEQIKKEPKRFLGFIPHTIGTWWDNNKNYIDLIAYDNKQIIFVLILWEEEKEISNKMIALKESAEHFPTILHKVYKIFTKEDCLAFF